MEYVNVKNAVIYAYILCSNEEINDWTGATYTVIGLSRDELEDFKHNILQSNMQGVAYDASGTELKLYGYIISMKH